MARIVFAFLFLTGSAFAAEPACQLTAGVVPMNNPHLRSGFYFSDGKADEIFVPGQANDFYRYDPRSNTATKVFQCDRNKYDYCQMGHNGVVQAQQKLPPAPKPKKGQKAQYREPKYDYYSLAKPDKPLLDLTINDYRREVTANMNRTAMVEMKPGADSRWGSVTYREFGAEPKERVIPTPLAKAGVSLLVDDWLATRGSVAGDTNSFSVMSIKTGEVTKVEGPATHLMTTDYQRLGTSGFVRVMASRAQKDGVRVRSPLFFHPVTKALVPASSFVSEKFATESLEAYAYGEHAVITSGPEFNVVSFSPDGKVKKVASGQIKDRDSVRLTRDGKTILIANDRDGTLEFRDFSGKSLGVMRPAEMENDNLTTTYPSEMEVFSADRIQLRNMAVGKLAFGCAARIVPDTVDDLECKDGNEAGADKKPAESPLMQALLSGGCQEKFKAADWDALTGEPPGIGDELPRWRAKLFLKRFEKKGGFEESKHSKFLFALLEEFRDEPKLFEGVLQRLLLEDEDTYRKIVRRVPDFPAKLAKLPVGDKFCQSKEEADELFKRGKLYIENGTVSSSINRGLGYDNLFLLRRFTAGQSAAWKEEHMDKVATKIGDLAVESNAGRGIFASKLYYFALNAVRPLFGEEKRPLGDVTVVRQNEQNRVVKLTALPSLGSDANFAKNFGFHVTELAKYRSSEVGKGEGVELLVDWQHDEAMVDGEPVKFSASVKLGPAKQRFVPNPQKAPDYKALWKDGFFTGAIVMGTSMEDPVDLMDEYMEYYKQKGFKLEPTVPVTDLVKWLQEKVQGGELDYLLKEAHSDGDDKNIFRIQRAAKLMVGRRKTKEGEEVIYLVYPNDPVRLSANSVPLSNQVFGQWMKDRASAGQGPLIYFNTSCESVTKAINELSAAGTNLFVNIPSDSIVKTFLNEKNSGIYQLLEGFRGQKTYEQIRTMIDTTTDAKEGEDSFLFPDMEEYKTELTDRLKEAIDIEVSVKDRRGKEYHLDEQIH